MKFYCNYNKKGFTIVELVIVIAIIAILAAVLIPTFKSVMSKANQSTDVQTASQMTKLLAAENAVKEEGLELDEATEALSADGYEIPHRPEYKNSVFYWVPGTSTVVLYDKGSKKVIYPKELSESEIGENWVDLTENIEPTEPAEPEQPENPEEHTDDTQQVYTLCSGASFIGKIKAYSPTKIVFGNATGYSSKLSGTEIELATGIKAYANGSEIYVLADKNGKIKLPANASKMFNGLTLLTQIDFGTTDTSDTTDMSAMFGGCTSLKSLDLSGFNTANVANMTDMFTGCQSIENIYVKTGDSGWKINSGVKGNNMFYNCKKLRNYKEPYGFESIVKDIFGWLVPDIDFEPDIDFAHTGDGGYLTEKV